MWESVFFSELIYYVDMKLCFTKNIQESCRIVAALFVGGQVGLNYIERFNVFVFINFKHNY